MVNNDDMVTQRTYTRRYQAILFQTSDSPIVFVNLQLCLSMVRGNVAVLQSVIVWVESRLQRLLPFIVGMGNPTTNS
jgi:predicted RNA polymerase sigma factor